MAPELKQPVRVLLAEDDAVVQVVTSKRLITLVWKSGGGDPFSLKTHISHIRHKLGMVRGTPGYISSVAYLGYRLEIA